MAAYTARRREETIASAFAFNDPGKIDELYPAPRAPRPANMEKWWG
jgi:hypothetical protein